jgi:hypothetical protein
VADHTPQAVNARILADIEASIRRCQTEGVVGIDQRLAVLDQEWDIERTLEANAASLALLGVMLSAMTTTWWLLLPGAVALFLLQHTIQGWCPPLPVLRWFGFRTQTEIDYERYALKALRGDFAGIANVTSPSSAIGKTLMEAVQR